MDFKRQESCLVSHVLYLHGFLSSPKSVKAQQTLAWCTEHRPDITLHIPQLSNYPSKVADQLQAFLTDHPQLLENGLRVIGSSMGGYLSSWLVEQYGGKAVLVNPAVRPYELLVDYIGDHVNPYTREPFSILKDDMAVLKALEHEQLAHPENYMVLLQTGDETLDYRQARARYARSNLVIEHGGDHSFVDYDKHLPAIFEFLES